MNPPNAFIKTLTAFIIPDKFGNQIKYFIDWSIWAEISWGYTKNPSIIPSRYEVENISLSNGQKIKATKEILDSISLYWKTHQESVKQILLGELISFSLQCQKSTRPACEKY